MLVFLKPGVQVQTDDISTIESDNSTNHITVTMRNGKSYSMQADEGLTAEQAAMNMGNWINARRLDPRLWLSQPPQEEEQGSRIVMPPAGIVTPN